MNLSQKLAPLALAASVGMAAATAPVVANAGASASFAVSNFYLYRGASLSNPGPAVSGSLDYAHDSGAYAGVWTSSEGDAGSSEYDVYVGYSMEAGDLGIDVNITTYEYPQERNTNGTQATEKFADSSELIIGLSFAGASFTLADSLQGSDFYYAFGYEMDKYSATIGSFSIDEAEDGEEYIHLDLSYMATEELTFTLSQVIENDDNDFIEDDLLVNVAWSKSWDL